MSDLPLCACGCGQEVTKPHNTYLKNHDKRIQDNPNLVMPLCQCGCGKNVKCRHGQFLRGHRQRTKPKTIHQIIICACGCNKPKPDRRGKYLRGHNRLGYHPRGTLEERFWSKVNKTETCWLWTGEIVKHSYGRITYDDHNKVTRYFTHRLAWELLIGPIPEGLQVCHNCPEGDNPACVNPEHLFLGTQSDNLKDCISKGRHVSSIAPETYLRGSRALKAKLTEEQIPQIRLMLQTMTPTAISRLFNVKPGAIFGIRSGKTWRHVV